MNLEKKDSITPINPEQSTKHVYIRKITSEDIEPLRPILECWVKDSESQETIIDEVDSIIESIKENINGYGNKSFFAAFDSEGKVLGMMGYSEPSKDMAGYSQTDKPVEFINAYVDAESRGQGVGKLLAKHLESEAKLLGYKEIIVNSGPRYQETGWAFWTRIYGSPIAVLKDYYGSGLDAPVWQKFIGLNK
jgi:GNAT superfamily N-acetyltransferase